MDRFSNSLRRPRGRRRMTVGSGGSGLANERPQTEQQPVRSAIAIAAAAASSAAAAACARLL